MAELRVYLSLAVCLFLAHQTAARNDAPCQLSTFKRGFKTFMDRHVRPGTPTSLNQDDWWSYLKTIGDCSRPTQSFLDPKELDRVKAVCSNKGGKTYKDNLCISQQPFTFVTVRSVQGTCGIKSVRKETKHLILACELLDNECVPVHFEGNPSDVTPDNSV
uniref:Si:dkey-237j11.3 n=1 Tax=Amphilophus citrinellus TaxID=61819 RepID=A0A3Q0RIK6_AMPCI